MNIVKKTLNFVFLLHLYLHSCSCAKINTPRVLLPWFENFNVNFTFEISDGGCYSWTLSRDDIIDIEPLYDDSWGSCSRAARVSVSKTCVPPGSVIILAEDTNTGEILRGDVDIDEIKYLKVVSTTWKLFLEEAPEAFEVVAYDDQENKFSTLEGVSFTWTIENLGSNVEEDPLVTLVRWRDTDYEAPRGVTEVEAQGLRSYSALLYGQAMGESRVNVCLQGKNICTNFDLNVVASVVLTPAVATIAPGDTIRYRVVRARAGRLTIQDVHDTLYHMRLPDTSKAYLEDTISLIRGTELGTTTVQLLSGATEVAKAILTIAEPHSIKVTILPSNLMMRSENFTIHCVVFDESGHPLTAGDEMLIRLTVEGEANVDLLSSLENGTWTDAVAQTAGPFLVNARLFSVAGKSILHKVEGQALALAVDPLEVIPYELYVAWTDTVQEVQLKHRGGADEPVTWSDRDEQRGQQSLSLSNSGLVTVRGAGGMGVRVQLKKHSHVRAYGSVWSAVPEYMQVSSSGQARVGKPHHLHVALTATHPETGELFNFHRCNCGSFAVSLLEGPEPHNVTAATRLQPIEGACCVLEATWSERGVSVVRVASRGRVADTARVNVRAQPQILWPAQVAALTQATVPVLALGESLLPKSGDPRIAALSYRDGPPPHSYPDIQMFTFKCQRKGDTRLELTSQTDEERESVQFEAACAPHVSRIRLEPPETPGNCSGGARLWLRPGHEVKVKVTLLDAVSRELLDERGPRMSWEISPKHVGIEYRAADRLFIETHPDFAPVPVPYKYYQVVVADERAVGWTGALKASVPDATASIQAKVVAPLRVDPVKTNIAWEGETISNISAITGGSGRYLVETSKGISANIESGKLNAMVPGPGSYDFLVSDQCVASEKINVEVNIEEILTVEVSTARAVCVGGCVPISALVKGVSYRYLTTSKKAEWRVSGNVVVKEGKICGVEEGLGGVRAGLGGVWSSELEVLVFPPLSIVPPKARLPVGARVKLRHEGGPPSHLATLHYETVDGVNHVEVQGSGVVSGLAIGSARVKLTARDIANVEMASAESQVEVIPITGLKVRSATQTLLVGSPSPLWIEAETLRPSVLAALQPPPRVTWTIRDPTTARLYTTHNDDFLERSVAEGLTIRLVPLKPGIITLDVRVRNMGQVSETRTWDSTIEILGLTDIKVSVDGLQSDLVLGERVAMAVGSTIRLKSLPRSEWHVVDNEGVLDLSPNGELKALQPGHGVVMATHTDERNKVDRQTMIHIEVSIPHYCTAEPSGDDDEVSLRIVTRNNVGRALIAPEANVSSDPPQGTHIRRHAYSALGSELLLTKLDTAGAFMTFHITTGGFTVTDEVWVTGLEQHSERIVACGSWAVCLEGGGWRAPPSISLYEGSGVSLAILTKDGSSKHVLKADRPLRAVTIHQLPIDKMEFLPGDWPSSLVPLAITASSLSTSAILCSEQQRYAMVGVDVALPFSCHTHAPHKALPVLNVVEGQMGCSIIPSSTITDASDVEVCAEMGVSRTCTTVGLLPPVSLSSEKVSLLNPPASFTVIGHPRALKLVKLTPSPGLNLETAPRNGELEVTVKTDDSTCGSGWVTINSRLTAQELRVEVEKECHLACGTVLGAIFALVTPYLSTFVTIAAVVGASFYAQLRLSRKAQINIPLPPQQTVLPCDVSPASLHRSTWSRSPYASNGPTAPVYGDASVLPDNSFSPNSPRVHSRFL